MQMRVLMSWHCLEWCLLSQKVNEIELVWDLHWIPVRVMRSWLGLGMD